MLALSGDLVRRGVAGGLGALVVAPASALAAKPTSDDERILAGYETVCSLYPRRAGMQQGGLIPLHSPGQESVNYTLPGVCNLLA